MHQDCQSVIFFPLLTFKMLETASKKKSYTKANLKLSWTHKSRQLTFPVQNDSWRKKRTAFTEVQSLALHSLSSSPCHPTSKLDFGIHLQKPVLQIITSCMAVPEQFYCIHGSLASHSRRFRSLVCDLCGIYMVSDPNESSWERGINKSVNDLKKKN